MRRHLRLLVILAAALGCRAFAQQNHIDTVTPSAPDLAAYGTYDIGVRTLRVTDKNRPDILNTKEGGPVPRCDRTRRPTLTPDGKGSRLARRCG